LWQRIPLQDKRRAQVPQYLFLFLCKSRPVHLFELRAPDCLIVIVSDPLLVIRKHHEALFKCLKFTSFIWTVRQSLRARRIRLPCRGIVVA
jgi:hypothetical protein